MGISEPGDKRLVLEIDRATDYAGKPLRANFSVMDADGSAYGHRLFGPKFAGMGGQMLKSYDLNERDRASLRRMLDEVEGRKPAPTKDEVLEVLRDASFGTDPAVSMIEAVEKLFDGGPVVCPGSPDGEHNRVVARDGEDKSMGYTHCGYCGTKR